MSRKIFKTLLASSLLLAGCAHKRASESCTIFAPADGHPALICRDQFGKDVMRSLESAEGTHGCFPVKDLRQCFDPRAGK